MESTKNAVMKKGKKPKSPTRYPKIMPTFVVAFAAQETLDDPQKVQLITNKRNAENSTPSIKSISPTDSTNSTKTFTISPTEHLSSILDIATLSEVKIDIIDENQCRDVLENKSPQISSYIVFDNRTVDDQPEIIFNAPKHIQRRKDKHRFPRKKPRKSKRVITFNNVHFKYKKTRNSITRRLEKYYEKTKLNTPSAEQFQKQIYCNVLSNVVSRSRVLKKVLAKVNFLADSDRISFHDGVNIPAYDDDSLYSSPATTKKSFISYTSQNTLVRKDSSPSTNEDFYSIKTANSLNQVTSVKQIPYNSEIINVDMAVEFNASDTNVDQSAGTSNVKLMHKENVTSLETLLQNIDTELTSKPSSSEEPKYFKIDYNDLSTLTFNEKKQSNNTLTQEVKSAVCSEEETFVIARTSSNFNQSSIYSDYTLTFNSQTTLRTENVQSCLPTNDELTNNNSQTATLLDKVKNLGFYPMKTPSYGSTANYESELNDVLVTEITDDFPTDKKNVSSLRKSIEVKKINYLQNNLSLPNGVALKAEIKNVEESKKTCADNVKNKYPTDLGEMWERLTLVLDLAVKRLEETLADRIVKDIKETLTIFKQPEYKVPTIEIQRAVTTAAQVNYERPIPIKLHKEIFVIEEYLKQGVDICVQCDLIQKQVIDHMMLKLSVEVPKPSSVKALKTLKPPELAENYVKIVKPPVALENYSTSVEMGKGDTVTVSTATTELSSSSRFKRINLMFSYPLAFIRENMIVLTSIPTFFIVLFCIYGIIVIIMQPL